MKWSELQSDGQVSFRLGKPANTPTQNGMSFYPSLPLQTLVFKPALL
jgi:hypothetical protein